MRCSANRRKSKDAVLILANTDVEKENAVVLDGPGLNTTLGFFVFDLLGQLLPKAAMGEKTITYTLLPGAVFCLAPTLKPAGLGGEKYRRSRALAGFAIEALNKIMPAESVDGLDWRWLAGRVARSPKNFLAAASEYIARGKTPLVDLLGEEMSGKIFPRVVTWTLLDARRVTLVPAGHWLLIEDSAPFRATLEVRNAERGTRNGTAKAVHAQSVPAGDAHVACFAPHATGADAGLSLERYATTSQKISAAIRFVASRGRIPRRPRNFRRRIR